MRHLTGGLLTRRCRGALFALVVGCNGGPVEKGTDADAGAEASDDTGVVEGGGGPEGGGCLVTEGWRVDAEAGVLPAEAGDGDAARRDAEAGVRDASTFDGPPPLCHVSNAVPWAALGHVGLDSESPRFSPYGADTTAIADFNDDGHADLATLVAGAGASVLGHGDGTFAPAVALAADARTARLR